MTAPLNPADLLSALQGLMGGNTAGSTPYAQATPGSAQAQAIQGAYNSQLQNPQMGNVAAQAGAYTTGAPLGQGGSSGLPGTFGGPAPGEPTPPSAVGPDSFVWGGLKWVRGEGNLFASYLAHHGVSYRVWSAAHPGAAAMLGPVDESKILSTHEKQFAARHRVMGHQ